MLGFAKGGVTEGTALSLSVPGGDRHHVWLSQLRLGNLPSSQYGAEQDLMCTELLGYLGLPGATGGYQGLCPFCDRRKGNIPAASRGDGITGDAAPVAIPEDPAQERWGFQMLPGLSWRTEAFPLYRRISTPPGELSTNEGNCRDLDHAPEQGLTLLLPRPSQQPRG